MQFFEKKKWEQLHLLHVDDDGNPSAATQEVELSDDDAFNEKNDTEKPKEYVIGGIQFPPLTAAVFRRRNLTLPLELQGKQRRLVHECCVEADLFHDSFGRGEDRRIVISCYSDGLDAVEGLQKSASVATEAILVHTYKPWYCRRERQQPVVQTQQEKENMTNGYEDDTPVKSNSSKPRKMLAEEKKAYEAVFKLIDQPGDCLRDERDVLVYEELNCASLADMDPPCMVTADGDSSCMLVDTVAKMKQCIEELEAAQPSEIAFDVESFNVNKHTQLTCLLQVTSDAGKEYVIDTLAPGVWDEVHGLAPLFANPNIVKIGHSIGGLDVKSMHRDFGCFLVNVFDTYEAAKILGLEHHGLAAVCGYYCLQDCATYAELKDEYQKCDWRVRPLTEPMTRYARCDVHFLIRLRWLMMRDIVRSEFWSRAENSKAESRMVAGTLTQTLVQFELDGEGTTIDENGGKLTSEIKKTDALDFMDSDIKTGEDCGDDATFKTPMQLATGRPDGDIFYTPSSSFRDVSFLDDDDDNNDEGVNTVDITAAQLRLQPLLMSCLSVSQERCRDLWSAQGEPLCENHLFLSLVKRSKRREVNWTPACTELYNELYKWRKEVAAELECLPGFIASLDFLVCVAWKRPMTEFGLRRIANRLPVLLEECSEYRGQIVDIVLRRTLEDGEGIVTATVYNYSSLNLPDDDENKTRSLCLPSPVEFSYEDLALKLFVAGTICLGVVAALFDARRRTRK